MGVWHAAMKTAVLAFCVALCLLPAATLLVPAFSGAAPLALLLDGRTLGLLLRSLRVAAGAAVLAALWGAGVAAAWRGLRGAPAAALEIVSALPLLLPPITVVMGWVFFCGRSGPVRAFWGGAPNLFGEAGAAFCLSCCLYPCVSILLILGLRSIPPAQVAVARLHTGRLRAFWWITTPLLAPYLATGVLLAFLLALGEYGIPSALGVNVFPVEIFVQLSAYLDPARAAVLSLWLLAIAVTLVIARSLLFPRARPTIGGRMPALSGPSRPFRALVGLLALPALAIGLGVPGWGLLRALGGGDVFSRAFAIAGREALSSLWISAVGAGLLTAVGLLVALALRRAGRRAVAVWQSLLVLGLVVPGAICGLGILTLYTRGWLPRIVYESGLGVAYAMLCRFVAVPALLLAAALRAIGDRPFDAARVCGVGRARTALRVALPLALPGIVAAGALSFVLGLRELSASALVSPPGLMTLPVRIASLLHFGEDGVVAALCLTLLAFAVGAFVIGLLLAGTVHEVSADAHRA